MDEAEMDQTNLLKNGKSLVKSLTQEQKRQRQKAK